MEAAIKMCPRQASSGVALEITRCNVHGLMRGPPFWANGRWQRGTVQRRA